MSEQTPTKKSYFWHTVLVYAALAAGAAYLWSLTSRQSRLFRAVDALASAPKQGAAVLLNAGPDGFRFLSIALAHDENESVRWTAGQTLVVGLLRALDQQVRAHPGDAAEQVSAVGARKARLVMDALKGFKGENPFDLKTVGLLLSYLDERTDSSVKWTERAREAVKTDKVSWALRDESPRVRHVAAAVLAIVGPASDYDRRRLAAYEKLEAALKDAAAKDPKRRAAARAALVKLERFGLKALAGEIADASRPLAARVFFAKVMAEIVRHEFQINVKSEVVDLLTLRAAALLMPALFDGPAPLRKVLVGIFTSSPNVTPDDLARLRSECGDPKKPDVARELARRIGALEGK